MSLRIIVRTVDCAAAANVGGPVAVDHKTFVVDLPELEAYLRAPNPRTMAYATREVTGIELLEQT